MLLSAYRPTQVTIPSFPVDLPTTHRTCSRAVGEMHVGRLFQKQFQRHIQKFTMVDQFGEANFSWLYFRIFSTFSWYFGWTFKHFYDFLDILNGLLLRNFWLGFTLPNRWLIFRKPHLDYQVTLGQTLPCILHHTICNAQVSLWYVVPHSPV